MSAERRETESETGKRIWQVYADHIGLPEAGPARSNKSLPREGNDRMEGRGRARLVGRLLAAIAVTAAMAGGMAVWLHPSASRDIVDRLSSLMAQRPAPVATAPREMGDAPGRRPTHDAPVARPIAMPPSTVVEMSGTLSTATKAESIDVTYRITFEFGSDRLNAESKRILDEIVAAMDANPEWRLTIEGHTDPYGTPAHNQELSERRAAAAGAYLQSGGIGPGRLSIAGFGASRPLAPNTALGNLRNRRVELRRQ
jgi:outer membrane protein OmpA-like peptidoglycan-associated protein